MVSKEDYEEPRCLLDMDRKKTNDPIPVGRVIEKADEYFSHNDYDGARRHLEYWFDEAKALDDSRGLFSVTEELIGLYRKTGEFEKGKKMCTTLEMLIEKNGIGSYPSAGTALVNIATLYNAAGEPNTALEYYDKAKDVFESTIEKEDFRYASLINNMASAYIQKKDYLSAEKNYSEALEISRIIKAYPEVAITLVNMADLKYLERGEESAEEIESLLCESYDILMNSGIKKDGYYAFVLQKCAASFGFHGFFMMQKNCEDIAKEIYERP